MNAAPAPLLPVRYLTHEIPGIGGLIKQRPEDFLVDEIPAYDPVGEGEHFYMLVQKRNVATLEMLKILANHFEVDRSAVGYAGLKDKAAITRQVVSIHAPGRKLDETPSLRDERLQILWTDYHTNKLRRGHLIGNRFSVRIRGVKPTDVLAANRVLQRLASEGVPNALGEQRFGLLANNHLVGRHLVRGDFASAVNELLGPNAAHPERNTEARARFQVGDFGEALHLFPRNAHAERAVLRSLARRNSAKRSFFAIERTLLRFYVSAFQSAVFNRVLDERLKAGTLRALLEGDIAIKHLNQSVFDVTGEVAADAGTVARLQAFEISPSGPMWGGGMKRAGGGTGAAELEALLASGVTVEELESFTMRNRTLIGGERRSLRVPVIDPEVEGGVDEHGAYVRCAFELPKGSFATIVLREIMKVDDEDTGGDEGIEEAAGEPCDER